MQKGLSMLQPFSSETNVKGSHEDDTVQNIKSPDLVPTEKCSLAIPVFFSSIESTQSSLAVS
jgi:hypothetical protein